MKRYDLDSDFNGQSTDVIDVVTTHMGDTLVGLALHNGQRIAELNDGFLWAV